MNTNQPISTISYNSKEFLIMKLNELLKAHTICFWSFIFHKAEKDESKDHIHLYIEPNKKVDTMDLQEHFREFDPKNPKRPLGVINFQKSKRDEWVLYVEHYPPYLASKFEEREFIYSKDDFITSDMLTFDEYYHHAFYGSEWANRNSMLNALRNADNPVELILNGAIPLNLASQVNALIHMTRRMQYLNRAGRENHENNEFTLDTIGEADVNYSLEVSDKDFFNSTIYRLNR